jgi:hypothetical protein
MDNHGAHKSNIVTATLKNFWELWAF